MSSAKCICAQLTPLCGAITRIARGLARLEHALVRSRQRDWRRRRSLKRCSVSREGPIASAQGARRGRPRAKPPIASRATASTRAAPGCGACDCRHFVRDPTPAGASQISPGPTGCRGTLWILSTGGQAESPLAAGLTTRVRFERLPRPDWDRQRTRWRYKLLYVPLREGRRAVFRSSAPSHGRYRADSEQGDDDQREAAERYGGCACRDFRARPDATGHDAGLAR